jgi:hypothetical protein
MCQREITILDPPPPQLKSDHPGGSEIHLGSLIYAPVSWLQILVCLLSLIPDPPPSIKGRTNEGVRYPIWTIDLSTHPWAVQMHANVISDFGPPPPPPVKSRMVGGVRNALCTVDLGIMIRTVSMCREYKWGAEKHMHWENLG